LIDYFRTKSLTTVAALTESNGHTW